VELKQYWKGWKNKVNQLDHNSLPLNHSAVCNLKAFSTQCSPNKHRAKYHKW